MVSPEISVIIPVYNDEKYLGKCLKSIFDSDYENFEVIVVNDGSTDNSLFQAHNFPCRIVNLKNNLGVANARNEGANAAHGDLLIFFDSDAVIEKDTISNFKKVHDNPNIMISCCSVYPESLSRGFTPDLLAMTWHYYYKLIGKQSSFIPTMGFSIYKKVFNEIGQFNKVFKSAGGEEFEIGMVAIQKGYNLYVEQSFCIHHHFQRFWPRCKSLFRRSYVYARIVLQRNFILDKGHGTLKEGVNAILSILGILALIISVFFPYFIVLFFITVIMQILLDIGQNLFFIKKRGILFFIRSIPVQYIWYFVMGLGVFKALLRHICQNVLPYTKKSNLIRIMC
jgi:glycosyltransferase involved in cell wall biosynthesis